MQKVLGYQIHSKNTHLVVQQKTTPLQLKKDKKRKRAKKKRKERKEKTVKQPPQLC